jgi:predicted dehydrogenase
MNVGVIGCGYWGPNLIRNLFASCRCDSVYCYDASAPALQRAMARFPGLTPVSCVEELFARCNCVLIATPVKSHYTLARKALEAGVGVFVEKPLTASLTESLELLNLAAQRKVPLMTGHTFLYSPPVRKIRQYIREGILGDICWLSASRVNLGKHRSDVNVLWDLAPHDLSMFLYWLGEAPVRVAAEGRTCLGSTVDIAWLQMEFPSGAVANVEMSWLSPMKLRHTTIAGQKMSVFYDDTSTNEKIKLFDSGATLQTPPNSFGEYHLSYRNGDMHSPCLESTEPLLAQTHAFLDWVEHGKVPEKNTWIATEVVACIEAACRSLQENGRFIDVVGTRIAPQNALAAAIQ